MPEHYAKRVRAPRAATQATRGIGVPEHYAKQSYGPRRGNRLDWLGSRGAPLAQDLSDSGHHCALSITQPRPRFKIARGKDAQRASIP